MRRCIRPANTAPYLPSHLEAPSQAHGLERDEGTYPGERPSFLEGSPGQASTHKALTQSGTTATRPSPTLRSPARRHVLPRQQRGLALARPTSTVGGSKESNRLPSSRRIACLPKQHRSAVWQSPDSLPQA